MARKRISKSDFIVSGAAPAPERGRISHAAHSSTAVPETPSITESSPAPAPTESAPDTEAIARLAYSYWEARGRQGGSPEEDWLRAEQELRGTRSAAAIA